MKEVPGVIQLESNWASVGRTIPLEIAYKQTKKQTTNKYKDKETNKETNNKQIERQRNKQPDNWRTIRYIW